MKIQFQGKKLTKSNTAFRIAFYEVKEIMKDGVERSTTVLKPCVTLNNQTLAVGMALRCDEEGYEALYKFGQVHSLFFPEFGCRLERPHIPMAWTHNMLIEKLGPILIARDDLGGCCDPATERYHAM